MFLLLQADVPTPEKEKNLLSPLRAPSQNFVKSNTRYDLKLLFLCPWPSSLQNTCCIESSLCCCLSNYFLPLGTSLHRGSVRASHIGVLGSNLLTGGRNSYPTKIRSSPVAFQIEERYFLPSTVDW